MEIGRDSEWSSRVIVHRLDRNKRLAARFFQGAPTDEALGFYGWNPNRGR
jgi:hypothetical protein